jgi:hypothetical protein
MKISSKAVFLALVACEFPIDKGPPVDMTSSDTSTSTTGEPNTGATTSITTGGGSGTGDAPSTSDSSTTSTSTASGSGGATGGPGITCDVVTCARGGDCGPDETCTLLPGGGVCEQDGVPTCLNLCQPVLCANGCPFGSQCKPGPPGLAVCVVDGFDPVCA